MTNELSGDNRRCTHSPLRDCGGISDRLTRAGSGARRAFCRFGTRGGRDSILPDTATALIESSALITIHPVMTAEDIARSYVRPRPEPRGRSKLAFWMIFVVVPLALFGAGEVAGARLSSMPWWIPVSAAILGLIVGLWRIARVFTC